MELLGTKHNPHTRPLPGRWTPFQNLMARCHLPCTKCSTDTISMTSEVQYNGLVDGCSTPHTSRGGYQADVSNLSSGSEEKRTDVPRFNQGVRPESTITHSDLPSSRSNNHMGLVFSPGRRAQLSRQQLSWMQALSKNNINTPPSLRDAQFLHSSSDLLDRETANNRSHSNICEEANAVENRPVAPPRSPGSNFSVEQTRVDITQHLLTDPSSDETEHSPLQSTIVDVYSLQNGNTMFNFDERNDRNSGSIRGPQSSMESCTFSVSENYPPSAQRPNESAMSSHRTPIRAATYSTEFPTTLNTASNDTRLSVSPNDATRLGGCNNVNETVFQNPIWQNSDSSESLPQSGNGYQSGHGNRNINPHDTETFTRDIWNEDTSGDDGDVTHDVSNVTDETTIGTSQESAEETVLLDYSENFTFNPISSQDNIRLIPPETSNEIVSDPEVSRSQGNDNGSGHHESQTSGEGSSERNLPVHLISLFENPITSSDTGSVTYSQTTQHENRERINGGHMSDTAVMHTTVTNDASFTRPFPLLNHAALNPNNQDRWATRIIRPNPTNSEGSRSNSQTVRSNASGSSSRQQLQNWYVYDPRLVPGHRQVPRLNLEMQYRGIHQLWSVPAIIGPPDYDDLSTLQSENDDSNDVTRPLEPPPPYMSGGIPPPTYDEAIFDSLFVDDGGLGLDNAAYVDPSPPPTISDISTPSNLHRPATLPSEVLQQLEDVLNLNSSTPFQSPGDTLTSCATHQSQTLSGDFSENASNSIQSFPTSGQMSPNIQNRISSISTYYPDSRDCSVPQSLNRSYGNHSVPLQSLRSALSAHLQTLNSDATHTNRTEQNSIQTSIQNHQTAPRNYGASPRSVGNIENYFTRPAVMYNRSVWSDTQTRTNFGLGNRLSVHNSSPDISQIH